MNYYLLPFFIAVIALIYAWISQLPSYFTSFDWNVIYLVALAGIVLVSYTFLEASR